MKNLLDLIFPKQCIVCKKEGVYLCEDCLSMININPFKYCLCEKIRKEDKCENCKNRSLDKIYSASSLNDKIVRLAIHKFKYSHIKELSVPFAFLILRHLQIVKCQIDDFILMPIPLSDKKKKKRGFNQSEEIAKVISEATKIENDFNCIIKIKDNKSQTELTKKERFENVKNTFKIVKNVKNKNILLLDDVYTTGATMEECAKSLKESGASKVWGVTVAREMIDL
jgi:ComF family protein